MQGFIILAIIAIEKHTLVFKVATLNSYSQWGLKCRSMCVLVEHVKDIYYARFHNPSHHRY